MHGAQHCWLVGHWPSRSWQSCTLTWEGLLALLMIVVANVLRTMARYPGTPDQRGYNFICVPFVVLPFLLIQQSSLHWVNLPLVIIFGLVCKKFAHSPPTGKQVGHSKSNIQKPVSGRSCSVEDGVCWDLRFTGALNFLSSQFKYCALLDMFGIWERDTLRVEKWKVRDRILYYQ